MTSFYHPDYLAAVAAEQAAPTTAAPQPPIDYGFNESQIARGIRSAVGATKAGLIGYGASAAELVGADETAQRWYAQALAEQQQAELDAPRVHSIRQVMESENPWGAGVDYAAGKVGEFLPYMALGAGAGMLGRAAGTAVGIGRGLRGTELAAQGGRWGHVAGAASFQPSMAGSNALEMYNEAPDMSAGERFARSQGVGALEAGIGAYVPAKMMPARVMERAAIPAGEATVGGALRRAGAETARTSVAGGAGVAAMDVVGQMHKATYDPNYEFNPEQTGEAFAGGVVGMAPISGVHSGVAQTLDMANRGAQVATQKAREASLPSINAIGERAYNAMPSNVQRMVDGVVAGDIAAGEVLDTVAPYIDQMTRGGKAIFSTVARNADQTVQAVQGTLDGGGGAMKAIAAGVDQAQLGANRVNEVTKAVAAHLSEALPSLSDAAKEIKKTFESSMNSRDGASEPDAIIAISKIMEDPRHFMLNSREITDEGLNLADEKIRGNLPKYLRTLQVFAKNNADSPNVGKLQGLIDEVLAPYNGDFVAATHDNGSRINQAGLAKVATIASLAKQVAEGRKLIEDFSPDGLFDMVDRLDGAQKRDGAAVPTSQFSNRKDVFNSAVKDAFKDSGLPKHLINDIAARVNTESVSQRGVTRLLRESLNEVFKKYGMENFNQTNPEAYNAMWNKVYDRLQELKAERLPDVPEDGFNPSERYSQHIAESIDSMLSNLSDADRARPGVQELVNSPEMVQQLKDAVAKTVSGLAEGKKEHRAAASKLYDRFERWFGDAGRQTVEEIVAGAHADYGQGSRQAQGVTRVIERRDAVQRARSELAPMLKKKGDPRQILEQMTADYRRVEALAARERQLRDYPEGDAFKRGSDEVLRRLRAAPEGHEAFQKGSEAALQQLRSDLVKKNAGAFNELKGLWGDYIAPKHFERVLEIVSNHDRATRPDTSRKGSNTTVEANRAGQEVDMDNPDYYRDVAENAEGFGDTSGESQQGDLFGGSLNEGAAKQEAERANQTGTHANKKMIAQYVGANAFTEGGHTLKDKDGNIIVPAPVNRSGVSAEHVTTKTPFISEAKAAEDAFAAKYGHRVAEDAKIPVADWANEMAELHGKDAHHWLDRALDALIEHDNAKLERLKLKQTGQAREEMRVIEKRQEAIAEVLQQAQRDGTHPGVHFFTGPGKNFRYLKIEQNEAQNLATSAIQLDKGYGLRKSGTENGKPVYEDFGAYVERQRRLEQVKQRPEATQKLLSESVYRDSFLPVRLEDGTIGVDFAKLVREKMGRHQGGDVAGVMHGENYMKDLKAATLAILSAITTAPGVDKADPLFFKTGSDKLIQAYDHIKAGEEQYARYLHPDLVLSRDPYNGRVLRVRDVFDVTGVDSEGRTTRKNHVNVDGKYIEHSPGVTQPMHVKQFAEETRGSKGAISGERNMPYRERGVTDSGAEADGKPIFNKAFGGENTAINEAAERGVVRAGLTKGGKSFDLDLAKMVKYMLDRNDIHGLSLSEVRDYFSGKFSPRVPGTLVEMLAREVLNDLQSEAHGFELSDAVKNWQHSKETSRLFDNAETVPRNYGDARLYEAAKEINRLMNERVITGTREQAQASVAALEKNGKPVPASLRRAAEGKQEAREKMSVTRENQLRTENSTIDGLKYVEGSGEGETGSFTEPRDNPNRYHPDDVENARMEQIVRELRDGTGDGSIPLFDAGAERLFNRYLEAVDTLRAMKRRMTREERAAVEEGEMAFDTDKFVRDGEKYDSSDRFDETNNTDRRVSANRYFEAQADAHEALESIHDILRNKVLRVRDGQLEPVKDGTKAESAARAGEKLGLEVPESIRERGGNLVESGEVPSHPQNSLEYRGPQIDQSIKENAEIKTQTIRDTRAGEKLQRTSRQIEEAESAFAEVAGETSRAVAKRLEAEKKAAATEAPAPAKAEPVGEQPIKSAAPKEKVMSGAEMANHLIGNEPTPTELNKWLKNSAPEEIAQAAVLLPRVNDNSPIGMQAFVDTMVNGPGKRYLEAAGIKFKDGKFERTNSQNSLATTDTGLNRSDKWTEVTQRQIEKRTEALVGDTLKIFLSDELGGAAGRYDPATTTEAAKALISKAAVDVNGAVNHEVWHHVEAMLKTMGKDGEKIIETIHKHVSAPMMRTWMESNFSREAAVLKQLDDPRERAAYAFQMFVQKKSMPLVDTTRTFFQKVWDFIKYGAGLLKTDAEKTNDFFRYVDEGGFKRDMGNPEAVRRGMGERAVDNWKDAVGEAFKPVGEVIGKVLGHSYERVKSAGINEYNGVLTKLAGDSGKGGMKLYERAAQYRFMNRFGQEYMKLDDAGKKAYENSPEYKAFLDDLGSYMATAKMDAKDIERVLARTEGYNMTAVNDRFKEFLTDVTNHGGVPADAAQKIASHIADLGHYADLPEWKNFELFKKRPDLRDKWMEKDFEGKTAMMVHLATKAAEYTRAFGADGAELKEALAKGDAKATAEQRQLMRDMVSAYNGTLGVGKMSPAIKQMQAALLTANNVRLLPRAVFSQMLEPLQIGARRNSLEGSLGVLFKGVIDMPKSFDTIGNKTERSAWEKFSYGIGSAPDRIIRNTMSTLMNGGYMNGKVGWLNDKFFQYNFMEQWSRTMHVEATREAVEFLRDHHELTGEHSKRFMEELGIEAGDVKFDKDGMLDYNRNTPAGRRVERAILQFVEEAMAHPDAGSNPMWMNDPRFALIAQMKRFTFAHARYVLSRGINEWANGNPYVLAPAMLALPWMAAADALRDGITGGEGYQSQGAMKDLSHYMERAGHMTPGAQLFSDTMKSAQFGKVPLDALGGPTVELADTLAKSAHDGKIVDTMIGMVPGGTMLPGF